MKERKTLVVLAMALALFAFSTKTANAEMTITGSTLLIKHTPDFSEERQLAVDKLVASTLEGDYGYDFHSGQWLRGKVRLRLVVNSEVSETIDVSTLPGPATIYWTRTSGTLYQTFYAFIWASAEIVIAYYYGWDPTWIDVAALAPVGFMFNVHDEMTPCSDTECTGNANPTTTTIPDDDSCNENTTCDSGENYYNCPQDCPAPNPIHYIGDPELIPGTIQGDGTAQYRFPIDDSICFATGEIETGAGWEDKSISDGYIYSRFKMGTTMRISIKKDPCGEKDFLDPVVVWPERAFCEKGLERRDLCSFKFTMPTGTGPTTTTTIVVPPTTTTTIYIPPTTTTTVLPPTTTTTIVVPPTTTTTTSIDPYPNIIQGIPVRVHDYGDGTGLYEITLNSYAPGTMWFLHGQDYLNELRWTKDYPTVRDHVIQVRWPIGTTFEASLQYFDGAWQWFGTPWIAYCSFWNGIYGNDAHFHFIML